MKRIWMLCTLISFLIIFDQITKGLVQDQIQYGHIIEVIPGFFNLTHIHNSGAAFGFGSGFEIYLRKLLFLFLPVLACLWLIYLIFKTLKNQILLVLSYSFILGGAVGNLIDRFAYGYVVDFLQFYYNNAYFPAFNVADSAITVGAVLLGIDFVMNLKK
jgi:signal peptidase II